MIRHDPAVLVLEDGTRYPGHAYGARGRTLGATAHVDAHTCRPSLLCPSLLKRAYCT